MGSFILLCHFNTNKLKLCRRIERFYGEAGHHLGEFGVLGYTKTEETKRAALLGIKEMVPQVFIQTTKMGY